MPSPEEHFRDILRNYAQELKRIFSSPVSANPEDQLKRPVCVLLESFSRGRIETRTETPVEGLGARPDIGVLDRSLLCGHVELKAPGKGANTNRFTGSDKEQWKKFQALPNIFYTDGTEWALYRNGERTRSLFRFSGDIISDGANAVSENDVSLLYELLFVFISWQPIVPERPKALAEMLAPLCRLLRTDVEIAASLETSNIRHLYRDWQRLLFPEADTHRFADAYAQTLTYALLLARLLGVDTVNPEEAARVLDSGHGLLARTLLLLGNQDARREMATAIDVIERVIQAVDPVQLAHHGDPWLYFYEDFLAAYDPKLRKDYGVYYTPHEVVGCQVRLCARLLEDRFNKPLNYADESVTFLDPAAGTAAYPLAAIQHGLDTVEQRYGEGMVAGKASEMARNFYAFENMVGPYAVAHLRITKLFQDARATIPEHGIHVFLTDTLENPDAPPLFFAFAERQIAQEHERARQVKRGTQILVCMGNPPYDREQRDEEDGNEARRKGGWIRFGSKADNETETEGILRSFIDGAPGIHVKNLYNDYVYFWRWALWKLYENPRASGPGILSFITASSYLRGPGFSMMRRRLRETFDEIWIIDLEGDNLGARKTENVFNIQTPVAIAIGVRYGDARPEQPATVRYTKITGTRAEKLNRLQGISRFEDVEWRQCYQDWEKPLIPEGGGDYFSWPKITNIFPWQYSGLEFKRTWPIGESEELLIHRWQTFSEIQERDEKNLYLRATNKNIDSTGCDLNNGTELGPLNNNNRALIVRYSYRSFDRQWIFADERICDRPRKPLWHVFSDKQIYFATMLTATLGKGPSIVSTINIPDRHFFCGRGGKDIIPIWRNSAATEPNITKGLLPLLISTLHWDVTPADVFAYTYALLSSPLYTEHFSEELSEPGPRLPLTKNSVLFLRAVAIGKRLIWLHTYGERCVPDGMRPGAVPQGAARCTQGIPSTAEGYPEDFSYNKEDCTLRMGRGLFSPVSSEVWNFSVSGLQVVKSWLDYRKKAGAGRRSSPLDEIRPERWSSQMTQELLELLWVLEHTISIYPELNELFFEVVRSECFTEDELPLPTDEQRLPPHVDIQADLFEE